MNYQLEIPDTEFFFAAQKEVLKSLCQNSRCGAVIVLHGKVIATGPGIIPPNHDAAHKKYLK